MNASQKVDTPESGLGELSEAYGASWAEWDASSEADSWEAVVGGSLGRGGYDPSMIEQGDEAPDFSLPDQDGRAVITNEMWVDFPKGYWNESGDVIGCVAIIGCTGGSPQYFWFQNSKVYGYGGVLSSQGPGTGLFEVTDYYYEPTGGWYVKAGTLTGGINGNSSNATTLQAGVETTTETAHNIASATNLDWQDLQNHWHYSNWASRSSHAFIWCESPATATWDVKYDTFGYGVNWNTSCAASGNALVNPKEGGSSSVVPKQSSVGVAPTGKLTSERLKTEVDDIATSAGESSPSKVEVTSGPRADSVASATPAFSLADTPEQHEWLSGTTYAVVLHGHFTFPSALVPGGAVHAIPTPTGTTLSLVIDASTGAVTSFDLTEASQQQPNLAAIGAVKSL
jgi:hypothetical protein